VNPPPRFFIVPIRVDHPPFLCGTVVLFIFIHIVFFDRVDTLHQEANNSFLSCIPGSSATGGVITLTFSSSGALRVLWHLCIDAEFISAFLCYRRSIGIPVPPRSLVLLDSLSGHLTIVVVCVPSAWPPLTRSAIVSPSLHLGFRPRWNVDDSWLDLSFCSQVTRLFGIFRAGIGRVA